MRVGPLPSGHILLTLDEEQAALAELVAAQREDVLRVGRRGARLASEDRQTHLEGAASEIAGAAFYGAPYDPRPGSDDGIDFWIDDVPAQVKSRPLESGRSRHALSILERDHLSAHVYFQCITNFVTDYTVELVGYARRRRVLETPQRVVKTDPETGAEIWARRIPESALSLISPVAIMDAMNRHSSETGRTRYEDAPPVPWSWGKK
jgi:hypothetical protein